MQTNKIQRRKLLKYSAAAVVGVPLLAACGGGDGDSGGGVDLNAAYDRVKRGMTEAQVIEAVGVAPTDNRPATSNSKALSWVQGSFALNVGLTNDFLFFKGLVNDHVVLKRASDTEGGW